MMIEEKTRATVTVEEAARILGIGRGLAYELCRTGKLPAVRLGKRLVLSRGALEKFLNGNAEREAA